MADVSSAEVQRNFGAYREKAEGSHGAPEPVMVMHYNKPSVVIIVATEYARLKSRDKCVLANEDLPEWLVNQIGTAEAKTSVSLSDDQETSLRALVESGQFPSLSAGSICCGEITRCARRSCRPCGR